MAAEGIIMAHVAFGVLGILAGIWLFVDILNVNENNKGRIKYMSIAVAVFMLLAYLLGGYWYVAFYGDDRGIITAGPWPWAHLFFMEVKEHLFFMLLLLSIYLPIVVHSLLTDKGSRNLVLTVAGLIVLLGLTMEGFGSVISMGVKMGLLGR